MFDSIPVYSQSRVFCIKAQYSIDTHKHTEFTFLLSHLFLPSLIHTFRSYFLR